MLKFPHSTQIYLFFSYLLFFPVKKGGVMILIRLKLT